MKPNSNHFGKQNGLQTRLDVLILLQAIVLASLLVTAIKLNF